MSDEKLEDKKGQSRESQVDLIFVRLELCPLLQQGGFSSKSNHEAFSHRRPIVAEAGCRCLEVAF